MADVVALWIEFFALRGRIEHAEVRRLVQPPTRRSTRRTCAFLFGRPDQNGQHRGAVFLRGVQSGIVGQTQIVSKPNNDDGRFHDCDPNRRCNAAARN
jgi:hypothetical protein